MARGVMEKTRHPGIYKRGRRYVVTFRDQQGTPRKKSAATLAEARDLKAAIVTDVNRGDYRPQTRLRFDAYAREWTASYQGRSSRGIRPETLMDYAADLERHAIPFLGALQLAEIEPRDLKRLAIQLADRGLRPATVRCIFAPVKALFATAYEDGLIRTNPAARLRLVQPSQARDVRKRKAMSEQELKRFLNATPNEWKLFFEALAHTGLRIGEMVALSWNDVDLGNRRLHVRRRRYRGRLDTPKSDYGIRTIPLSAGLAQKLWRHRANKPADTLVFPNQNGGYLLPENVRRRVLKPIANNVGLPWVGFHSFRHTCATILFRNGLNAKQVQSWLGHHSPAFTLATYVHLLPDDYPDTDFLDTITSQQPPSTKQLGRTDRGTRSEDELATSV